MDEFEKLLYENRGALERFVKFRLPSAFDADDVLQEVYIAAHEKFGTLTDKTMFKAWIIGIARHKCNDYFRKRAKAMEIPIDEVSESALSCGRMGITETNTVRETLSTLASRDKEILYLYFFREIPQADIAKKLGIPIGTVKSRIHTAKANFKEKYPYPPVLRRETAQNVTKGVNIMKKFPEMMPEYVITKSEKLPFSVRHEELPGMMIIPRTGEKVQFGTYDFPNRKLSGIYRLEATNHIVIHGIEGVEISSVYEENNSSKIERKIWAQLNENHCRYLGGVTTDKTGLKTITTFLDDTFSDSYSIGENNSGFEIERTAKGLIYEVSSGLIEETGDDISDIVGRYMVEINNNTYDTVRLVDIQYCSSGQMLCEYYLDHSGRTILWRRFNSDNWAFDRYKQKWSEKLPDNERLNVNDETYVHWYDCITDYIL